MKFCILVGHGKGNSGGYDPGAVNGQYHEFKLAREIAKAAAKRLKIVYHADCGLLNEDGTYNLPERIAKFQDHAGDFLAEIHLNAGGPSASGTEVYFFPGDDRGQAYAAGISEAVSAALGIPNRGAKASDYYGIIRETVPTAVLVETCFIGKDLDKVKTAAGQLAAGNAIADGIAKASGLQHHVKTGWVQASSAWYWYEDGAPVKSRWVKDGGWWYYLGQDGKMLTGYQQIGGKLYYLNERRYDKDGWIIPYGACVITDSSGAVV